MDDTRQKRPRDPFNPAELGLPVVVKDADGNRIGNVWSPSQNGLGDAMKSVEKGESGKVYFDSKLGKFTNAPVSTMTYANGKIKLNVSNDVANADWYKRLTNSDNFKDLAKLYAKDPTGKTIIEVEENGETKKHSINDLLKGYADDIATNSEKYQHNVNLRTNINRLTNGALTLTDDDLVVMTNYEGFSKDSYGDGNAVLLPDFIAPYFSKYDSYDSESQSISAKEFYNNFFYLDSELPEEQKGIISLLGYGLLGDSKEALQQLGESDKDYAIDLVRLGAEQEMNKIVEKLTFNKDTLTDEQKAYYTTEYAKCFSLYKTMTKDTPGSRSWTGFNLAVQNVALGASDQVISGVESVIHAGATGAAVVTDAGVRLAAAISAPFSWLGEMFSNLFEGGWDKMTQETRNMYEHFDDFYAENTGEGSIPAYFREQAQELGRMIDSRQDLAGYLFNETEYEMGLVYANSAALQQVGRMAGFIINQILITNAVGSAVGETVSYTTANAMSMATVGTTFTNMAKVVSAMATTATSAAEATKYLDLLNNIGNTARVFGFAANLYAQGVVDTFLENPSLTDALMFGADNKTVAEFQDVLRTNVVLNGVGEFMPFMGKGGRKAMKTVKNTKFGAVTQAFARKAINRLTLRGRKIYQGISEFMTDKVLVKEGIEDVIEQTDATSAATKKMSPSKRWQNMREDIIKVQEEIKDAKLFAGEGTWSENAKYIDELIDRRIELETKFGITKKLAIAEGKNKIIKNAGLGVDIADLSEQTAELTIISKKMKQANLPGSFSKETGDYINDLYNKQLLEAKEAGAKGGLSAEESKEFQILKDRITKYENSLPSDFATAYKTAVQNYLNASYRFYDKLADFLSSDAGGNLITKEQLAKMRGGLYGAKYMGLVARNFSGVEELENALTNPGKVTTQGKVKMGDERFTRKAFSSETAYYDPNYARDFTLADYAGKLVGLENGEAAVRSGRATILQTDADGKILKTPKDIAKAKNELSNELERLFSSSLQENTESLGKVTVNSTQKKIKTFWSRAKSSAQRKVKEILGLDTKGLKTYASTLNSEEIQQISNVYSMPTYSRKIASVQDLEIVYNGLSDAQKKIVKKTIPDVEDYFSKTSDSSAKTVGEDPLDVFDKIPSTPKHNELLNAMENGEIVEFVYMTPDEYIEALTKKRGGPFKDLNEIKAKAEEPGGLGKTWRDLYEDMKARKFDPNLGEGKFPAPYIEYSSAGYSSQEGIHRAFAAKELGVKKMPVSVRYMPENMPMSAKNLLNGKEKVVEDIAEQTVDNGGEVLRKWNNAITNNNLDVKLSRQYIKDNNAIIQSPYYKDMVAKAREKSLNEEEALALRESRLKIEEAETEIIAGKEGIEKAEKKVKGEFKKTVRRTVTESVDATAEALIGSDNPYLAALIREYEKAGVSSDLAKKYIIYQWLYDNIEKGGVVQHIAFDYYSAPSRVSEIKASTDSAMGYSKNFRDAAESVVESKLNKTIAQVQEEGVEGLVDMESTVARTTKYLEDISDMYGKHQIIEAWDRATGDWVYYKVDRSTYNLVMNYPTFQKNNLATRTLARINSMARIGQITLRTASLVTQGFKDTFNAVVLGGWDTLLRDDPTAYKKIAEYIGQDVIDAFQKEMTPDAWKSFLAQAEWDGLSVAEAIAKSEVNNEFLMAKIKGVGTSADYFKVKDAYSEIEGESGDAWAKNKNKWQAAYDRGDTAIKKIMGLYDEFSDTVSDKVNILHNLRENNLRKQVYRQNFMDALSNGKSLQQARNYAQYVMENATTNFSRGVAWGQNIVRSIPYFGAMLNGASSMIRMLEIDPVGVMMRFTTDIVIPTVGLTVLSLQNEKDAEIYKNIPEWDKEQNLIWVVNGQTQSVPLPEELSKFILPIRHAVEKMHDANDHAWGELLVNDILNMPTIPLNAVMMLDEDYINGDPTVADRLSSLALDMFNTLAPTAARTAYIAQTGRDPYTGKQYDKTRLFKDANGEYQYMTTTEYDFCQDLANVFKGWGWEINPLMAQGILNSLMGTGSLDLIEGARDLISSAQQGEANLAALLEPSMTRAGNVLTGSTLTDEKKAEQTWYSVARELKTEKNELLAPDGKLAKYANDIDMAKNAKDQAKAVEFYNAEVRNYQDSVMKKISNYTAEYGDFFNRYKFASAISYLTANLTIDKIKDSTSYYDARAGAVATMYDAGFNSPNDHSIFGYASRDWNTGVVTIEYSDPLVVSLTKNALYYQGDTSLRKIEETIEYSGLKDEYNNVFWPAYSKALDKKDWNTANKLAAEWDIKVIKEIKPIIDEYHVGDLLKNSSVIDFLDNYIRVPSTTDAMGKGKYYSSKTGLNKNKGFAQSYIKKVYNYLKEKK